MNNKNVVYKTEQPGALVMVILLDVISVYLGTKSIDILKDYNYACKRLYSKIRSLKIGQYDKNIEEMKLSEGKNQSNTFETKLRLICIYNFKRIIFEIQNTEYEKNMNLLIDFLVPVQNRLEINEINKKQIITFYYKIFAKKTEEDIFQFLMNFIMKVNNYKIYIINGRLKYLSEHITQEVYNIHKADLFIKNYELALNRLKDNSVLKN